MKKSADDMFQKVKNRSCTPSSSSIAVIPLAADENSKTTEKYKTARESKKMGKATTKTSLTAVAAAAAAVTITTMAEGNALDMKPLRVLVERTKFNEMQVADRATKAPLKANKTLNVSFDKKRGLKKSENKVALLAAPQKTTGGVDGVFRIRKCYVKIPKDKVLIRLLLAKDTSGFALRQQSPPEQKRSRGRPRKKHTTEAAVEVAIVDNKTADDAITDDSAASVLKRKQTEAGDSAPPAKKDRKPRSKGNGFFININALTRTPSPRRKVLVAPSPTSPEEEPSVKAKKKSTFQNRRFSKAANLNVSSLRQKFGNRFFKSYVKVRRLYDPWSVIKPHTKKNTKNLSVSFLETVEVFGDSSDGEDWLEHDETAFSTKGARWKRLENGNDDDVGAIKPFSTSTPCGNRNSNSNTTTNSTTIGSNYNNTTSTPETGIRKSILKRREKVSFSPLKEEEVSPRKEHLKLANEKIVRLSFGEQQHRDEEERDIGSKKNEEDSSMVAVSVAAPTIEPADVPVEISAQVSTDILTAEAVPTDDRKAVSAKASANVSAESVETVPAAESEAIPAKVLVEKDKNDNDNDSGKEICDSSKEENNRSSESVEAFQSTDSIESVKHVEPEPELITPPPSTEKYEFLEYENENENLNEIISKDTNDENNKSVTNQAVVKAEVSRENSDNFEDSRVPSNTSNEQIKETVLEDDKEDEDESFQSAKESSLEKSCEQYEEEDSSSLKPNENDVLQNYLSDISDTSLDAVIGKTGPTNVPHVEVKQSQTKEDSFKSIKTISVQQTTESIANEAETILKAEIAIQPTTSTTTGEDECEFESVTQVQDTNTVVAVVAHVDELTSQGEISDTSQVNISNTSDQSFVDASDLVTSVLSEAEEVLNDVCEIAAADGATLISETNPLDADVVYVSRPVVTNVSDDVDDDDFTSVLTHPEVERSLQSAASTLVPNSQEIVVAAAVSSQSTVVSVVPQVDVTEDTFASVVAEVERFTKDVNPEIYADGVGITGADVMMDNVQVNTSLDNIFDDDDDGQSHMFLHFPDDLISSLRMSSGTIDIGHDKSLPIQVIETEVMAIPNEPDLIFDKPLGTTASILGTSLNSTNDSLTHGHGPNSTIDSNSKINLGRLFQSVKSYVMPPGGEKNSALQD